MNIEDVAWTYSSIALSSTNVIGLVEQITYEEASGTLFVLVKAPPYRAHAFLTGRRSAFDGMLHDDIFHDTILRHVGRKAFADFFAALSEKANVLGIAFEKDPHLNGRVRGMEIFLATRRGENGSIPETANDNDRTPINP